MQQIDSVYRSLEECYLELDRTRVTLGGVRNRSQSLVPVNKLPAETFAYIASLANTGCMIEARHNFANRSLQALFNTSRHLRHILKDVPSLWNHVDLIIDQLNALDHGRLHLNNSGQLSLRVHILERRKVFESSQVTDLVDLLRPYIDRIVSLNFKCSAYFVRRILRELWQNASSEVQDFSCSLLGGDREHYTAANRSKFFDLEETSALFTQNIRKIKLYGPFVWSDKCGYRRLTVLKLQSSALPPFIPSYFADTMAASPDLRCLTVIGIQFQGTDQAQPAMVPKLEVLDVRLTQGSDLRTTLSCIIPGSHNLALSISVLMTED
ncbi:hypothetical protein RhiLY_04801 [Ceratobasidium sp. AG-Ba]|nr:hypothetical protein RhiLY_04801 [Ceratobasidium sp. AG-Ba]